MTVTAECSEFLNINSCYNLKVKCDNLKCALQSAEESLELSQSCKAKRPIMRKYRINLKHRGKKEEKGRELTWKVMTKFSSVQLLSRVQIFATPWTAALQASLSITTARVYSNSCPLKRWCHQTISSSVIPFSSRLQFFPASGSFQMSQFFVSGVKVLEFQFQHQSFQWILRTDFL